MEHTKNNDIIIIDGRLRSREEMELVRRTMTDLHKDLEVFHGIEMASLYDNVPRKKSIMNLFRNEPNGITIIGPATVISEMKQHPDRLELKISKDKK
jgi:hypothetical protein